MCSYMKLFAPLILIVVLINESASYRGPPEDYEPPPEKCWADARDCAIFSGAYEGAGMTSRFCWERCLCHISGLYRTGRCLRSSECEEPRTPWKCQCIETKYPAEARLKQKLQEHVDRIRLGRCGHW